ncbi:CBS domain-containing protein [Terasakiella pusilla]|jgi:CBS domain-containing protein|uniref:CBS domain-containing protein n=1 Tax=Terasakiella pusilla TaxID=64973 RepID=UPI003AA9C780
MLFFENYATVKDVLDLKRSERPDHAGLLKVPFSATLMEVILYMADHNVGVVLVYDTNENIIGVVSERDIIRRIAMFELEAFHLPLAPMVSKSIFSCTLSDKLKRVASDMAEHHVRHVAVKDEDGQYIGVISSSDIELFAGQG